VRVHIATFDSLERHWRSHTSGEYNRQNCEIARHLFQNQPGVIVSYWCEMR
jgi:hypothetical protein